MQIRIMRWFVAGLVLCLVSVAHAANPKYDCTTSCTFVSDTLKYADGTFVAGPLTCKLYSGATLKASSSASPAVGGGLFCSVAAQFAVGTYSTTMTIVDAAGQESPPSVPFVFDSARSLPAPANVRIQ